MRANPNRVFDPMLLFRRLAPAILGLSLVACDWFTDFKDQPRIEPWEAYAAPGTDSAAMLKVGMRGQPQYSVPVNGAQAPGFWVSYVPGIAQLDSMSVLTNPVAPDARSLADGRKDYQINCAVCHGEAGQGDGLAVLYGMIGMNLVQGPSLGYSDGYIFGIIRNGRGLMANYNRIEEMDRWDVVNYIRGLQGRYAVQTGPLAAPGVNGAAVPGYSATAPTLPSPYLRPGPLEQAAPPGAATPATASPEASVITPDSATATSGGRN